MVCGNRTEMVKRFLKFRFFFQVTRQSPMTENLFENFCEKREIFKFAITFSRRRILAPIFTFWWTACRYIYCTKNISKIWIFFTTFDYRARSETLFRYQRLFTIDDEFNLIYNTFKTVNHPKRSHCSTFTVPGIFSFSYFPCTPRPLVTYIVRACALR